jgi:hypothetical protein
MDVAPDGGDAGGLRDHGVEDIHGKWFSFLEFTSLARRAVPR